MCMEREKVDFKSREVNCLKECALALKHTKTEDHALYNEYILNCISYKTHMNIPGT